MKLLRKLCLLGGVLLALAGSAFAGDAGPFYATDGGRDGRQTAGAGVNFVASR